MGTFAPERQNGIEYACPGDMPPLQAQREPFAGYADQH
jgi:hypothetical protein